MEFESQNSKQARHCWHGQLARVALYKAWLRLPIHQSVKLVRDIPPCSVQFGQIKYSRSVRADDMSFALFCSCKCFLAIPSSQSYHKQIIKTPHHKVNSLHKKNTPASGKYKFTFHSLSCISTSYTPFQTTSSTAESELDSRLP